MANNYIVTSAIQNPVTDSFDLVGSVNGVSVTVHANLSAVPAGTLSNAIAFENYVATLMLAAYNAVIGPTAVAAVPAAGLSFSK